MGQRGRPKKIGVGKDVLQGNQTRQDTFEPEGTLIVEVRESSNSKETVGIEQDLNSKINEKDDAEIRSCMEEDKGKPEKQVEVKQPAITKGAHKGISLNFLTPILKNGEPIACLLKKDVDVEIEKWNRALILYVVGENPTISFLRTFMLKQCEIQDPKIYYHNEGYFVVRLESMELRDQVIAAGPYTIANRPVIMKKWEADFCFEKEVLKEVPLWIQLPNLPLHCWGANSLSRIGSILGKPVCADEATSSQQRISYARLLVEIDITQPIKYKIHIEDEEGNSVEQRVLYDWIPPYCSKCKVAGHDCIRRGDLKAKPQTQKWIPKVVDEKQEAKPGVELQKKSEE